MTSEEIVKNDAEKSPVWQYFGFYKNHAGIVLRGKAVCCLCRSEFSYSGNTMNLQVHVERHHPQHNILNAESAKEKSSKQPTLLEVVKRVTLLSSDSERHLKLVCTVGKFIAVDLQPLLFIEITDFLQLMKIAKPRFQVSSRGYFT